MILASGGYPGDYEKGKVIGGLANAGALKGVEIFHAGTREIDGRVLTNGGRVLGVTAVGAGLAESCALAYRAADEISFDGQQRRNDIGATATAP